MGQSVAILEATGSFVVSASGLQIVGAVSVADGLIGSGSGVLIANWGAGDYSLSVNVSLFDGTFDVSGQVAFDSAGDFLLTANASVNVPDAVPVIGGDQLGDLGFGFKYDDNSGSPTGFVAAWDTVSLGWFGSYSVGFEYDLDGDFSLLGSGGVSSVQSELYVTAPVVPAIPDLATSPQLQVPAGTAAISLNVSTDPSGAGDYILQYPGGQTSIDTLASTGTRDAYGVSGVVDTAGGPVKVTITRLTPGGASVLIGPASGGRGTPVPAGTYALEAAGASGAPVSFDNSFSYILPTIQTPTVTATAGSNGTVPNSYDLAVSGTIPPQAAATTTVSFYETTNAPRRATIPATGAS